ncbi:MAG TPA: hypothetical protein VMS31_03200 [Pyrinomonadaceae bacterium]|nr:hypothetical protein [Pyrinomonadaceae bacterium]
MRAQLTSLFEQRRVLVDGIARELFTPLVRCLSRLRLHRFRRIRNVGILVADDISAVDLYDHKLLVVKPIIPRSAFAAEIYGKACGRSPTPDKLIAYRHGYATTELPLRLLPTLMNTHLSGSFDPMTISLCEN